MGNNFCSLKKESSFYFRLQDYQLYRKYHASGGEHHDPNMPPPGGDDHSGDTHSEPDIDRCALMHPGGPSRHVDPPEALIERITREYEGRLRQAPGGILLPGQLLSGGTYSLLRHPQNGSHIPPEVDCYLREGRDNHPPAGNP
jgi:hypothetical protein